MKSTTYLLAALACGVSVEARLAHGEKVVARQGWGWGGGGGSGGGDSSCTWTGHCIGRFSHTHSLSFSSASVCKNAVPSNNLPQVTPAKPTSNATATSTAWAASVPTLARQSPRLAAEESAAAQPPSSRPPQSTSTQQLPSGRQPEPPAPGQ